MNIGIFFRTKREEHVEKGRHTVASTCNVADLYSGPHTGIEDIICRGVDFRT